MRGRNTTALRVRLNDQVIEEVIRRAAPEELSVGLWIKKLVEDTVGWKPPIVEESS
jgi:hypothetical protein